MGDLAQRRGVLGRWGQAVNVIATGTVCLGGELPGKLDAWRAAGGDGVELWRADLDGQRDQPIRRALGRMKVVNVQPLHDYAGCPADLRAAKRTEAAAVLSEARYWDAALLCCAATHPRANRQMITRDLRDLAHWAELAGTEIWYEALPWSTWDHTLPAAWERVVKVDRPNVKVVVDTWHHLVTGGCPSFVRRLDPARVGLVQISDLCREPTREDLITVARNDRALPGDGYMAKPITMIVDSLLDAGYAGPFSAEAMNRSLRAADPYDAAGKIMAALGRVLPTLS